MYSVNVVLAPLGQFCDALVLDRLKMGHVAQ